MDNKITIKQIAEMAGVSVAAVSFVVNGKKGVSEETRQKILDIIEKTNYTPNVNSQRLILQKSFNIIVALDREELPINNFFYAEIMNSMVHAASKLGYNIVLVTVREKFEGSRLSKTLMQHNADGVIFLGDISREFCEKVERFNVPYVIIDSQKNNPDYHCVRADYLKSSYAAVKYLIDNGHKDIAIIGSDKIPDYFDCNFEGFKKVMEDNHLTVNNDWIQSKAVDTQSCEKCMQNILDQNKKPTGIFCTSDIVAICVMNYLQKKGYQVPGDFSVCSIDDISMSEYHFPSLTTIHIDKKAMGESAVKMLDKLINGEDTPKQVVVSSEYIVERNSVKKVTES